MGGDHAPGEIIEGARQAAAEGVRSILFGDPAVIDPGDLPLIATSEAVDMHADPGSAVRRLKDASVVRAAEAVRDGKACAMVSAGNTGAAMASALLRMGRLRNVARPAIAIPFPIFGREYPNLLLDCGANADCQPSWLLQFACMGAVDAQDRFGVGTPRVGLLSIGEEETKGNALVKEAYQLLSAQQWQEKIGCSFVGNVEGRDLLDAKADVIVTDGFTGNVMLKTSEGVARHLVSAVLGAFDTSDETKQAAGMLMPALAPLYESWNPDTTGGGVLLGIGGICVISHGSSRAAAIKNAILVAHELVERDAIAHLQKAMKEYS